MTPLALDIALTHEDTPMRMTSISSGTRSDLRIFVQAQPESSGCVLENTRATRSDNFNTLTFNAYLLADALQRSFTTF